MNQERRARASAAEGDLLCDVRGCGARAEVRISFGDGPENDLLFCRSCAESISGAIRNFGRARHAGSEGK